MSEESKGRSTKHRVWSTPAVARVPHASADYPLRYAVDTRTVVGQLDAHRTRPRCPVTAMAVERDRRGPPAAGSRKNHGADRVSVRDATGKLR